MRHCRVFGDSDNVRVVFSKSDRVGLWFYQLALILSNGLTYMLHLKLHNVRQLHEGSFPVCRVVDMWSIHVLGGPFIDKAVDILLALIYYHSKGSIWAHR